MARKHSERAHAQWSASSTERNWLCPGNIALNLDAVKPPESKAAAWGTACHQIAEKMLKGETVVIGDRIETERYVFYVDDEFLQVAGEYVGHIMRRVTQGFDVYAIEQAFDLSQLLGIDGMQAGGTCDCILYNATAQVLEVVDLKTGKGTFVDAKNNPQERFYGLGALLQMDQDPTPVSRVVTTIVQPRYQHPQGAIRSEGLDVVELMDWTIDLAEKMRTAQAALAIYADVRNSEVKLEAWVDMYLNPGEIQCPFCPAAGSCPALRRNALAIAGAYEDDSGIQFKSNRFTENTTAGVERDLDMLEQLEAWIRERRALAHEMAVRGLRFDHWHLVERIGHRKYTLDDDAIIEEIRKRLPVSEGGLVDIKVKSPAGLERMLGKSAVEFFLGDLIEKPVVGTDLIRSTHTGRTAVESVVDRFFIEQDDSMETYDGTGK